MTKQKHNYIYLTLQILLVIATIYFLLAYCFEWNSSLLTNNNLDAFINAVASLAFSFLPPIIKRFKIQSTRVLETYYLLAIIFHFMLGRAFNAYHTPYFSFVIHFINSFLMGVICYGMILRTQKTQGKLFMFISTLACVALIGAVWEIVEFIVDAWFDGNMQRTLHNITREPFLGKHAVRDTMLDLCMDVLGGGMAGILSSVIIIKSKPIYIHFELKSSKFRKPILGTTSYFNPDKTINKNTNVDSQEKNKLE